jgi:hypothetical protein
MNERIRAAMVASGYHQQGGLDGDGGLDLTQTVFTLGGGTVPNFGNPGAGDKPSAPANLRIMAIEQ